MLIDAMREEAARAYPEEACGLIVAIGKKARFIACKNSAAEPTKTFRIAAKDFARASDLGEVLAVWHSHPDGTCTPSEFDVQSCNAHELPWFISAVEKQGEKFIHTGPQKVEPAGAQLPYTERPYVFGVTDCFSLTADYYQREFGITLHPFLECREEEWWLKGRDHFGENFSAQGFVPVTDDSWQDGDLLFFAINSDVPNHVAIYVTGDIILHHMINRLSRRETCGPYWLSHMTHHLRHTQKC